MNFKPAVETPVILMSQNRDVLDGPQPGKRQHPDNEQDHELVVGADFDKPIYYRQILIRSLVIRVDAETLKPNRERIEGLQIPGSLDCPNF
jgi:hypothetical protein